MKHLLQLLSACLLLFSPQPVSAQQEAEAELTSKLRGQDQRLLDAFAVGGVDIWARSLSPDAIYVDENGAVFTRSEFLKQLVPLPAGITGQIHIKSYALHHFGDLATVIHTDDEDENYHGQLLRAQYLMTETWQLQGKEWKLVLIHAFAVQHAPAAIALDPHELGAYEGRYTAGDGLVYAIKREGDHLIGGREGRTPARLVAEIHDVFFVREELRTRKIFRHDASGKISGFVDRREGTDLVWKRL